MTNPSEPQQPSQQPFQQPFQEPTQPSAYASQPAQSQYPTYPPGGYPYAGYGYGPAQPQPQRRSPWRAVAAGAVAGAVLAAAVAIPTTIDVMRGHDSSSSASAGSGSGSQQDDPFGSFGTNPFGDEGQSGDSGGLGLGDPTTQQSGTKASSAQSTGVVLVDTVLNGGAGAGTGMVIASDGLVLTNYHVVHGSTSIKVTVASTGTTYDATVVGHDASADVALIKLDGASDLDTVSIDKDPLAVKDAVTAVGNASGQGFLSAVTGTVVAQDQHITASEGSGPYADSEALTGLIETDAAVVPGYSGGPLLDADGEVVGIDTAASTTASMAGATENAGQAYAIPIEDAMTIAEQIENGDESDTVQIGPSPFLGIGVAQAQAARTDGASVGQVEAGAAAAKAGLVAGDVITRLGDSTVTTYDSLVKAIAAHEPGDEVALTWTDAAGKSHTATVTLGSNPAN